MSLLAENDDVQALGLRFSIAAMSEQGPRPENQDAYSIDLFATHGWVAVADGMGGERGGRLAADTALAALADGDPIHSLDDARRAVRAADSAVIRAAERNPEETQGMGCALCLLALADASSLGPTWIAAHVGDVRIISRSPDGATRLETRDHTPAFARWEAGEISIDEIADSAGANRLQRAVGRGGSADVGWLPARPGWSWLIISDGVYKVMRLDELAELMAMNSPEAACQALRQKVSERGPDDNYTAVFVRALGGPPGTPVTEDRTEPMIPATATVTPAHRSGPWGPIAAVLALVALALAGYALWSAQDSSARATDRMELERLRTTVDSLRLEVQELNEPFGLATPEEPVQNTVDGGTSR
jgi:serine/threonine protein phosphatase PrpC